MRRETNLFERILEPSNLLEAYLKARKGKTMRPDVTRFTANLNADLTALRKRLQNNEYHFDRYSRFKIFDPKERIISAAPFADRVVQHAIMNLCSPVFERAQIFDSYACRPGKGPRAALERAALYSCGHSFYLKLDVRKYFGSISHSSLRVMLARLFKEPRLLALFDAVIDGYSPYLEVLGKGLPIGNLTSQYFANHYLAGMDHWIKEELGVSGYVRYMDDMVLWGRSSREMLRLNSTICRFAAERLGLVLKPPCVNRTEQGLPFVGFTVFPKQLLLSSRSCRRVRRRLRSYVQALDEGRLDQKDAGARARAVLARTDWTPAAVPLRRKLITGEKGRFPRAGTASYAAGAGTTTPGTVERRLATGTSRLTATTTSAFAWSWPAAQGKGRMSSVEPESDPVLPSPSGGQGEAARGGRVLVAQVEPSDEGSRSPIFSRRGRRVR